MNIADKVKQIIKGDFCPNCGSIKLELMNDNKCKCLDCGLHFNKGE